MSLDASTAFVARLVDSSVELLNFLAPTDDQGSYDQQALDDIARHLATYEGDTDELVKTLTFLSLLTARVQAVITPEPVA